MTEEVRQHRVDCIIIVKLKYGIRSKVPVQSIYLRLIIMLYFLGVMPCEVR